MGMGGNSWLQQSTHVWAPVPKQSPMKSPVMPGPGMHPHWMSGERGPIHLLLVIPITMVLWVQNCSIWCHCLPCSILQNRWFNSDRCLKAITTSHSSSNLSTITLITALSIEQLKAQALSQESRIQILAFLLTWVKTLSQMLLSAPLTSLWLEHFRVPQRTSHSQYQHLCWGTLLNPGKLFYFCKGWDVSAKELTTLKNNWQGLP